MTTTSSSLSLSTTTKTSSLVDPFFFPFFLFATLELHFLSFFRSESFPPSSSSSLQSSSLTPTRLAAALFFVGLSLGDNAPSELIPIFSLILHSLLRRSFWLGVSFNEDPFFDLKRLFWALRESRMSIIRLHAFTSCDKGLELQQKHNHSVSSGASTISLSFALPRLRLIQVLQNAFSHLSQQRSEPPSPHHRHCSSTPNSSRVNGPELKYRLHFYVKTKNKRKLERDALRKNLIRLL